MWMSMVSPGTPNRPVPVCHCALAGLPLACATACTRSCGLTGGDLDSEPRQPPCPRYVAWLWSAVPLSVADNQLRSELACHTPAAGGMGTACGQPHCNPEVRAAVVLFWMWGWVPRLKIWGVGLHSLVLEPFLYLPSPCVGTERGF